MGTQRRPRVFGILREIVFVAKVLGSPSPTTKVGRGLLHVCITTVVRPLRVVEFLLLVRLSRPRPGDTGPRIRSTTQVG